MTIVSARAQLLRDLAASRPDQLEPYLDGLDDHALCGVGLCWPGGQAAAPVLVRTAIRAAVRRRRQLRGWDDWPDHVRAAARAEAVP